MGKPRAKLPGESASTDFPLYPRPGRATSTPPCGAAQARLRHATYSKARAAPIADPKRSAIIATLPRPVAHLRG